MNLKIFEEKNILLSNSIDYRKMVIQVKPLFKLNDNVHTCTTLKALRKYPSDNLLNRTFDFYANNFIMPL